MKKTTLVLAAAASVLLLGGSVWWSGRRPVATPATSIDIAATAEMPTTNDDTISGAAVRERARSQSIVAATGTATPDVMRGRLLDAAGRPLAGVPWWLDERAYPTHPAEPPRDAAHTDADGGYSFARELAASGAFVWFRIDEHFAIACPADAVEDELRAPRRHTVEVTIDGLPDDESWWMMACPAWDLPGIGEEEQDPHHGDRHCERLPGPREIWVSRWQQRIAADRGAATARFVLCADLPYVVYCYAPGYVVEPELQLVAGAARVHAQATQRNLLFQLQLCEIDGLTPATLGGQWSVRAPDELAGSSDFVGGRADIEWTPNDPRAGKALRLVADDGERFEMAFDDPRLRDRQLLRLRRGSGIPPQRRVPLDEAARSWTAAQYHLMRDGGAQPTTEAGLFSYFSDPSQVAVWRHGDELIVVTTGDARADAPILAFGDGQFAIERDGEMRALRRVELEPIEPAACIGRCKRSRRDLVIVDQQIDVTTLGWNGDPEGRWLTIDTWTLHRVEGLGWRQSHGGSLGAHAPLAETIPTFAPSGCRSRLVLATDTGPKTTIPLRRR